MFCILILDTYIYIFNMINIAVPFGLGYCLQTFLFCNASEAYFEVRRQKKWMAWSTINYVYFVFEYFNLLNCLLRKKAQGASYSNLIFVGFKIPSVFAAICWYRTSCFEAYFNTPILSRATEYICLIFIGILELRIVSESKSYSSK